MVVEEQKNVVKKKREASEELTNIISAQLKKLKNDNPQVVVVVLIFYEAFQHSPLKNNPQVACLKIMVEQRKKLLSEEADAQKILVELKKDQ